MKEFFLTEQDDKFLWTLHEQRGFLTDCSNQNTTNALTVWSGLFCLNSISTWAPAGRGIRGAVALPWNVENWYCHPSHPYKMCKNKLILTLKFIFLYWDGAMVSLIRVYFILTPLVPWLSWIFLLFSAKFSVGAHVYRLDVRSQVLMHQVQCSNWILNTE